MSSKGIGNGLQLRVSSQTVERRRVSITKGMMVSSQIVERKRVAITKGIMVSSLTVGGGGEQSLK